MKYKTPVLSNYKSKVFDCDGTLFDTLNLWNDVYNEYLLTFGVQPHENFQQERLDLISQNANSPNLYVAMLEGVNKIYGINLSGKEALAMCTQISDKHLCQVGFKNGAGKLLRDLSDAGETPGLYTLSNNDALHTLMYKNQNVKREVDMRQIFGNRVLTSDTDPTRKTGTEGWLRMANMVNSIPKRCLVIEDSYKSAYWAKKAGYDVAIIYEKHSDIDRDKLLELTPYHFEHYDELVR